MIKTMQSKNLGLSYGWLVVLVSALLMTGFMGTLSVFGVLLKPLAEEFNWTRAMTSGAMSVVQAVYGFTAIAMGHLTDRYGARMFLLLGAIAGGLGYFLLSQVNSLWQFYLYYGLFVGICAGTSWAPINATVSRWFVEKRVLALSFATLGTVIGYMVLPPFMAMIIEGYGWRLAYIILAIIVFASALPAVIVLRRKPPQKVDVTPISSKNKDNVSGEAGDSIYQKQWTIREATKSAPFWMLVTFTVINSVVFFFVSVHIVPYITDTGISTASAALIFTFINGSSIAGIFLAAPIAARLGNRGALLLFLALQAATLFLFILSKSLLAFFVLAIVFGFGLGGTNPLRAVMVSYIFGMRAVGTILGLIGFSWAIGGVIGPYLSAYIFDVSQSYNIAFLFAGFLNIIAIAAVYYLGSQHK